VGISQGAFNTVVPLLSALLGGFLSYLATTSVERRRWRQEKQDRLAEEKRKALGLALEWLQPLESKVFQASMVAGAALQGTIGEDEIHDKWPGGFGELSIREMPRRLLALLPEDLYRAAVHLQLEVFWLLPKIIACNQAWKAGRRPVPGYQDVFDSIGQLEKSLEALQTRMDNLYRESFN
jgi:hypothetical protein